MSEQKKSESEQSPEPRLVYEGIKGPLPRLIKNCATGLHLMKERPRWLSNLHPPHVGERLGGRKSTILQ